MWPAGSVHELPFSSNNVNSRSHSLASKQYGVTSISSALSPGQRCVSVTCRSMLGCSTGHCCVVAYGNGLLTEPLKPLQQAPATRHYMSTEQLLQPAPLMHSSVRLVLALKSQSKDSIVHLLSRLSDFPRLGSEH